MLTDVIKTLFDRVIEGLKQDAQSKDQKIPVKSLRYEVNDKGGSLFAAHYFKYLFTGRGPGKAPPPEAMLDYVRKNPERLTEAKQRFKYITEQGLAYIIGQKIAKHGTDIHEGKKPGIDFLGVLENAMPDLMKEVARNEMLNLQTSLRSALKVLVLAFFLIGCGSVQTINGVRIPRSNDKPNVKNYVLVGVASFGFGYYLGSNVLPQKKN